MGTCKSDNINRMIITLTVITINCDHCSWSLVGMFYLDYSDKTFRTCGTFETSKQPILVKNGSKYYRRNPNRSTHIPSEVVIMKTVVRQNETHF